jgi:hypothetical protein
MNTWPSALAGNIHIHTKENPVSYILVIWTVVGYAGMAHSTATKMDWRSLGEFHGTQATCEIAAQQLGLKSENYRCVRSK